MTNSVTSLEAKAGSAWHVNSIAILTALGYVTGTGSPNGTLTPVYVGQEYYDTTGKNFWRATDTTNSSWIEIAANSGSITLADGDNIVLGTTTGSMIGTTTTQLLGFFGKTPVVQQAGATAVTTATITTASTSTTPFGYATSTQANNIASEVAECAAAVNALLTQLAALGLIA